jgi:hypothetical protein
MCSSRCECLLGSSAGKRRRTGGASGASFPLNLRRVEDQGATEQPMTALPRTAVNLLAAGGSSYNGTRSLTLRISSFPLPLTKKARQALPLRQRCEAVEGARNGRREAT